MWSEGSGRLKALAQDDAGGPWRDRKLVVTIADRRSKLEMERETPTLWVGFDQQ